MYRKAEAGIGTLILFIALILVAAVAAGVLIQTSSSLQSKALTTGSKAESQVSTQVVFNVMWGQNGSQGRLSDFFLEMKLAPGSDPIKLNDTLVEFVLANATQNLRNAGTVTTCDAAHLNQVDLVGGLNNSLTQFSTQYVVRGSNQQNDYLQTGDTVLICFNGVRSVNEGEEFRLQVIPKSGGLSQMSASTPAVMTTFKVDLFP
jgi:flagellin-like protein